MVLMGQWRFPFTVEDLRHLVTACLDKKGAVDHCLYLHMWLNHYICRHKTLTLHQANSIKRTRAAVSREEVNVLLIPISSQWRSWIQPTSSIKMRRTSVIMWTSGIASPQKAKREHHIMRQWWIHPNRHKKM